MNKHEAVLTRHNRFVPDGTRGLNMIIPAAAARQHSASSDVRRAYETALHHGVAVVAALK